MATDDFGLNVSYTYDEEGYNYDTVVFEAHKPPLDTELNYSQQIAGLITRRQMSGLPSGWITLYPTYTDTGLQNNFYTQNPTGAKPEYALVNGHVVYVTNTGVRTKNTTNANLIELGDPPTTGNRINGVFLEVWRALLAANDSTNKPLPASIVDTFRDIYAFDGNNSWICGDNGILLNTQNGGQTWNIQAINTQRQLNGLSFITVSIGYVVGNAGLIARTASGGASWTVLQAVTGENLNDVFTIDQVTSFAVGTSGIILKTTNGVSFGALASGVTTNLNKVHFHDSQVGWVVGDSGVILKTTSGGAVWLKQVSNTLVNLHSVFFYDLNYGFAVGDGGTILKTSDGGSSWVNQSGNVTTENLLDVTMVPNLDRSVTEEVSSQANGINKTFIVSNTPVTVGDGKGTTTNNVQYVTVTVNGASAAVDALNGTTGEVLLNVAPALGSTVKISYYYLEECALFRGKAWIVGTTGTILYTDNVGATWQSQTSTTAYDLYSVNFVTETKGWISGSNAVILYTENGGSPWTAQNSELSARVVQQVFYEGNVDSQTYLVDQSIHPDANVETTKRVQVQYKIRVLSNADPVYSPEAGLGSAVLGEGPNASGSYPYQNMGPINGDYGCWRAECLNTVDGYCYAIPMFFVGRRNSSSYDPAANANGSYQTGFVRPDILTATMVVDQDILDVRRRVALPSVSELLPTSFDKLTSNLLKTNFARNSVGGDQYGTELLQLDRVGGNGGEGGTLIGATMADATTGAISSEVVKTIGITTLPASPPPSLTTASMNLVSGFYHPNPAFYKAAYASSTATVNGKPIPGYFTGVGTTQPTFVFGNNVLTSIVDTGLASYTFSAPWYGDSTKALSYVPSKPQLVKNFVGTQAFYYQGVLDSTSAKVIESWDSGIYGYKNYALAYSYQVGDPDLQYRASPVELHYFMQVPPDTSSTPSISVPRNVKVSTSDPVTYDIYSIRRINNITAGFSHRISNIYISGSDSTVTAATGYNFVGGHILEVVAEVTSAVGNNIRNGAAVNFNQGLRGVSEFFLSEWRTVPVSPPSSSTTISSAHGEIFYGISTTETGNSLDQTIAWDSGTMFPLTSVSGLGTSSLTISWTGHKASLQIQLLEKRLYYPSIVGSDNPGLLIGYNYVPYQTTALPTLVTGDIITSPTSMYVSNLGAGGGALGEVYSNPIEQIPVSGTTFSNDLMFHNMIPLQFANFTVEDGFAQLPVINPALIPNEITFSNPTSDSLGRTYYQACSKDLIYQGEGLQLPVGRKIYLPALFRINDPGNQIFVNGEYVLVIFSRSVLSDSENVTGSFSGGDCSIAIYRLPNRPTSRI